MALAQEEVSSTRSMWGIHAWWPYGRLHLKRKLMISWEKTPKDPKKWLKHFRLVTYAAILLHSPYLGAWDEKMNRRNKHAWMAQTYTWINYWMIWIHTSIQVFPKIGKHPKMDGFFHGKPQLKWMIWGGNPPFKETSLSGYQGWHILVAQTGYTEHRIDLPFPGAKRFMQPKKLPWFWGKVK